MYQTMLDTARAAGYPNGFTGERLAGEHLLSLVEGLEKNALLDGYTHLLTGYIGSVSFLQMLLKVVGKLREASPGLVYVCDPVLGDEGKVGHNQTAPASAELSCCHLIDSLN
eukprot:SAG31_NODE_705_length_12695_cov_3.147007_7_plen_112_part_00